MAIGGTIYGYIQTPWGLLNKAQRRHNVRVLEHLPREDPWPPLIAKMFGITGPSVREGAYDHDLIHYGATLKGLDDKDAILWIAKFESLLCRLNWTEAVMHIDWIFGYRTFRWRVDDKHVRDMCEGRSYRALNRWHRDDGGNPILPWSE